MLSLLRPVLGSMLVASLVSGVLVGAAAPVAAAGSVSPAGTTRGVEVDTDAATSTDSGPFAGGDVVEGEPTTGLVEVLVGVAGPDVLPRVIKGFRDLGSAAVTHRFTRTWSGFSGVMDASDVPELRSRPGVTWVVVEPSDVQGNASSDAALWGVDRLDQRSLPLDKKINRPDHAGAGVDVYVVDNGVMQWHNEFLDANGNSRVVLGNAHSPYSATKEGPCRDHGTPIASIIAGNNGIAPGAQLVSYQIGCGMTWKTSLILKAIEDISRRKTDSGRPSVLNLSMSHDRIPVPHVDVLADAIHSLVEQGVVVVTGSGNASHKDSCDRVPANMDNVITVGATGETDMAWLGQSMGSCTDVFAPGLWVTAASVDGADMYNYFTGTSFAAPHVAGLAALLLADNPNATPAQIKQHIVDTATRGLITGQPPVTAPSGDLNRLAHYSYRDGVTPNVRVVSRAANSAVLRVTNYDPDLKYAVNVPPSFGYVSGVVDGLIELSLTDAAKQPFDVSVTATALGVTRTSATVTIPKESVINAAVQIGQTIPLEGGFDFFITSDAETNVVVPDGLTVTYGRHGRVSVRGMGMATSTVVHVNTIQQGKVTSVHPVIGESLPFDLPSGYFTSPPTEDTRVQVEVFGHLGVTPVRDIEDAVKRVGGEVTKSFTIAAVGVVAWIPWHRLLELTQSPGVVAVLPVDTGGDCSPIEGQVCDPAGSPDAAEVSVTAAHSPSSDRPVAGGERRQPIAGSDPVSVKPTPVTRQSNAPEALSVIGQRGSTASGTFTYPSSAGEGVTIYVWDQFGHSVSPGVQTEMSKQFPDGRDRALNWPNTSTEPCKVSDHGSLVSMAAAGQVVGIAKKASVVKVPNTFCGRGISLAVSLEDMITDWGRVSGAQPEATGVVNMSFGPELAPRSWSYILPRGWVDPLPTPSKSQLQSIEKYGYSRNIGDALHDRGLLLVSAAGNRGSAKSCDWWPSNDPHSINVGSHDKNETLLESSNYGPCVDIYAYGSLDVAGKKQSGTSIAAPYVAGWAATLMGEFPGFPVKAYRDAILNSSTPTAKDPSGTPSALPRFHATIGTPTGTDDVARQVTEATSMPSSSSPEQCNLGFGCSWIDLTPPRGDGTPQQYRFDVSWDDGTRTQNFSTWLTSGEGITIPVWGNPQPVCTRHLCERPLPVTVTVTTPGQERIQQNVVVDLYREGTRRELNAHTLDIGAGDWVNGGWEFPLFGTEIDPRRITLGASAGTATIEKKAGASGASQVVRVDGVRRGQEFAVSAVGTTSLMGQPVFFVGYFNGATETWANDIPYTYVDGGISDADSITWELDSPTVADAKYAIIAKSAKSARIVVSFPDGPTPQYDVVLTGSKPTALASVMVAEIVGGRITKITVLTGVTRAPAPEYLSLDIKMAKRLDDGFRAKIINAPSNVAAWRAETSHGTVEVTGLDGDMPIIEVTGLLPRQKSVVRVFLETYQGDILTRWILGAAK